jgi:tRNA dimethylallyltransferase
MSAGQPGNAKPFDFIGYRELRAVLRNEMTLPDAKSSIQLATRRYAKRQLTWFRPESGVRWWQGFGDDLEVQRHASNWLGEQGLHPSRGADTTSV